jgi:hypothetical protein
VGVEAGAHEAGREGTGRESREGRWRVRNVDGGCLKFANSYKIGVSE